MEFGVLASGSCGNVSLLRLQDAGILVDAGLGPRLLEARLDDLGVGWLDITAVLLTHTHGDHWREKTLCALLERRIPLHCHEFHHGVLSRCSQGFAQLSEAGLVKCFRFPQTFRLGKDILCRALPLSHDNGVTCGFRIDSPEGTLGYASDLGSWKRALVDSLTDVDILALEFNHDVELQRSSNRPRQIIARVLSDAGHLSNEQAADLVRQVLIQSRPGRLRHLVQLHLSQQCNRDELALRAAEKMLNKLGVDVTVHTAAQDRAGPWVRLEHDEEARAAVPALRQGWLPGWQ